MERHFKKLQTRDHEMLVVIKLGLKHVFWSELNIFQTSCNITLIS